jgi:hypothetical protein
MKLGKLENSKETRQISTLSTAGITLTSDHNRGSPYSTQLRYWYHNLLINKQFIET